MNYHLQLQLKKPTRNIWSLSQSHQNADLLSPNIAFLLGDCDRVWENSMIEWQNIPRWYCGKTLEWSYTGNKSNTSVLCLQKWLDTKHSQHENVNNRGEIFQVILDFMYAIQNYSVLTSCVSVVLSL